MLEIKNLHAEVDGKKILNGLDLTVGNGEVAAIMGPNGSGKSTLAYILAGKEDYEVTAAKSCSTARASWSCRPRSAPRGASSWRSSTPWRFRASRP